MMPHPIPDAVLAQHTAILGKTGSGKTSTEKLAIEQVVAGGFRVCVLDSIKSDWWGITSSGDGKKPGLPFKILGGPRGHVPLHSSAGKVIGRLVGEGKLPLSIIDMADFEPGGLQRFFVDFAPALMRFARGVIYLVIEEAHEFAPKERAGIGVENLTIHWMKKLATAGRSKGIRLVVATQRTQALHNAVLGSCETVITHRLTTPADQEPVIKWLKANVGKDTLDAVASSLSSLPTGTGWVCSGEARIFEKIAFPKFKTYDNTATPTRDGIEVDVNTAPVDQDELRSIIGDAVKEAEANDPTKLKAEITRLTAALNKSPKHDMPDPAAIEAAEKRGYERGWTEGNREGRALIAHLVTRELGSVRDAITSVLALPQLNDAGSPSGKAGDFGSPTAGSNPAPAAKSPKSPSVNQIPEMTISGQLATQSQPGDLPASLQRALDSIVWWHSIGFDEVARTRAAITAGLSPTASTFGVYIGKLVERGLVEAGAPGHIRATPAGMSAGKVPAGLTVLSMARALLEAQPARVFDLVVSAYPEPISRGDLADKMGLSRTASTLGVYVGKVSRLGFIDPLPGSMVRAADFLFSGGTK